MIDIGGTLITVFTAAGVSDALLSAAGRRYLRRMLTARTRSLGAWAFRDALLGVTQAFSRSFAEGGARGFALRTAAITLLFPPIYLAAIMIGQSVVGLGLDPAAYLRGLSGFADWPFAVLFAPALIVAFLFDLTSIHQTLMFMEFLRYKRHSAASFLFVVYADFVLSLTLAIASTIVVTFVVLLGFDRLYAAEAEIALTPMVSRDGDLFVTQTAAAYESVTRRSSFSQGLPQSIDAYLAHIAVAQPGLTLTQTPCETLPELEAAQWPDRWGWLGGTPRIDDTRCFHATLRRPLAMRSVGELWGLSVQFGFQAAGAVMLSGLVDTFTVAPLNLATVVAPPPAGADPRSAENYAELLRKLLTSIGSGESGLGAQRVFPVTLITNAAFGMTFLIYFVAAMLLAARLLLAVASRLVGSRLLRTDLPVSATAVFFAALFIPLALLAKAIGALL